MQDLKERCELLKEQYQQTVVVATAAKEEAATAAAQAAQAREAAARERERARETEARPTETAKPAAAPTPAPAPAPVSAPVSAPVAEPESTEALQSDVLDHVAAMRAKKLAAGAGGLLHTQADADLRATVAALRQVCRARALLALSPTACCHPSLGCLMRASLFVVFEILPDMTAP